MGGTKCLTENMKNDRHTDTVATDSDYYLNRPPRMRVNRGSSGIRTPRPPLTPTTTPYSPPHGAYSRLAACWQALISSGGASLRQDCEQPHEGRADRSFFHRLRHLIRARVMAPVVAKTLAPIRGLRTRHPQPRPPPRNYRACHSLITPALLRSGRERGKP